MELDDSGRLARSLYIPAPAKASPELHALWGGQERNGKAHLRRLARALDSR